MRDTCVVIGGVLLTVLLVGVARAQDMPLVERLESDLAGGADRQGLEQKYPDINFNWPEGSLQPAAVPGSMPGETMPAGSAALAAAPGATQIAEEEVMLRERKRRGYVLGPGDVMSINVRDHPEFSSYGVRVGYAGEIILPLTNEVVYAEGLTIDEIRTAIENKLSAYIERPFVSVFITEFNSKKFYILGEIGAGIYPIGATSITLMDALYAAGLPSEGIAAMRRVQIITPHETHPINRWVNVYAILYKGRMEHNITIEPGTIIYVPSTILTKMSRMIRQVSVTIEDLSRIPNDLAAFDAGLVAWDRSWNMGIFPKGISFGSTKYD